MLNNCTADNWKSQLVHGFIWKAKSCGSQNSHSKRQRLVTLRRDTYSSNYYREWEVNIQWILRDERFSLAARVFSIRRLRGGTSSSCTSETLQLQRLRHCSWCSHRLVDQCSRKRYCQCVFLTWNVTIKARGINRTEIFELMMTNEHVGHDMCYKCSICALHICRSSALDMMLVNEGDAVRICSLYITEMMVDYSLINILRRVR